MGHASVDVVYVISRYSTTTVYVLGGLESKVIFDVELSHVQTKGSQMDWTMELLLN